MGKSITICTSMALAIWLAAAIPCRACLNDEQTPLLEEKHRLQYEPTVPLDAPSQPMLARSPFALAGLGTGAALMMGSMLYALRRKNPAV